MQTYIVAVSGGIDSVSLLDMLVHQRVPDYQLPIPNAQLIVAHFDHGIRGDSAADAHFVQKLADEYGLICEIGTGHLGDHASEETARRSRYTFLQIILTKYDAAAIITAHHQDDLIETALINLIRGTGWRGLISLKSNETLIRPLLSINKAEIRRYAKTYNLEWHEDSTNKDEAYLRNYVRQALLPKLVLKEPDFRKNLLEKISNIVSLSSEIKQELQKLIPANSLLSRYNLIMWPEEVAQEVIYVVLTRLDDDWHPSKLKIKRVLHFCKSGQIGSQLEVSKNLKVVLTNRHAQFKKL